MRTGQAIAVRGVLGFDFYGAGNIGDDLMLAGFLEAARRVGLGDLRLVAATRWNLDALRRRFPQIDWAEPEAHAARLAGEAAAGAWWAGVGDTPFQFSVGPWFLRMLRREQRGWGRFARRVMVNVGAEREVVPAAADFRAVVADLDRISTRDTQTADILVDALGVAPERVLAAADLAHVAMSALVAGPAPAAEFELGLIAATYRLAEEDVEAIGRFVAQRPGPVAWLANDMRRVPGHELHAVEWLAERLGTAFSGKVEALVPDYASREVGALVAPIGRCGTVLSSRYHGLLAAAWAGARVGALGGASKVESLAAELGVPVCRPPLTVDGLLELEREAMRVDPAHLRALERRAVAGVAFALGGGPGGPEGRP